MAEFLLSPDFLMAVGSVIGISSKMYSLKDKRTVWSRKSSGLNVVTYPVTAIYPIWKLELWLTLVASVISFSIWIGIFLFRSPEEEDIFGRVE